jgi:CheY-like chemotaxis protein
MRMASDNVDTPPEADSELRILLVDDDAESIALLARQLERAGHRVKLASDPDAALAEVESFRPDVAIIDLGLPIMSGYELARQIRAICACKLVALSGYGRDSAPPDKAVTSFDRHLMKPVDAAALLQIIRA